MVKLPLPNAGTLRNEYVFLFVCLLFVCLFIFSIVNLSPVEFFTVIRYVAAPGGQRGLFVWDFCIVSDTVVFVQLLLTRFVRHNAGSTAAGVREVTSVSAVLSTGVTTRESASSRAMKSRDCTPTTLHLSNSVDRVTRSVSTAAPGRSLLPLRYLIGSTSVCMLKSTSKLCNDKDRIPEVKYTGWVKLNGASLHFSL